MARADSRIPPLEIMEASLLKEQRKYHFRKLLIVTVCVLVTVAVAAAITAIFFLQILRIDGTSMAQTLQEGDLVIGCRRVRVEKGDVIAFYHGEDILVKRIIATAGDTVNLSGEGEVTVNGEPIEEPYLTQKALGHCSIDLPCQVPEGKAFVMGDYRAVSIDSRSRAIGCIDEEDIIGTIFLRVWPIWDFGFIR